MRLKYYAEVDDIHAALAYYQMIFNLKVIKDGNNHINFKIENQITIMLCRGARPIYQSGYFVIRFEAHEVAIYQQSYQKIKTNPLVKLTYDQHPGRWGTSFTEFVDRYGITWDLEIDTALIG